MNGAADIGFVQIEQNAQNMHRDVLAQIEQRAEQTLCTLELELISPTNRSNTCRSRERSVMSQLPARLDVAEQFLELLWRGPSQPRERRWPLHQLFHSQHA